MPILQGEQGIGKGYIIKRLAQSWFIELRDKIGSSHALDAIQRGWIIELPEMSAMTNTDLNVVKAFTSGRDDTHRFAYERRAATIKRHGVFFSNSNKKFPLKDKTGNRHFPILEGHRSYCDFVEGLTDDYIQQFWAEVLVKYNELFADGFDDKKLLLSKESLKIVSDIADQFTEDDGMTGEILAFLDTFIPYKLVWNLLSKEERRKFFSDSHFSISKSELLRRQAVRKRPEEMEALKSILEDSSDTSIVHGDFNSDILTFYGAVLRDSICASEIYNECFGVGFDQRKTMNRISEILARDLPPHWHKFGRKKCGVYGDQKTVYIRDIEALDKDNIPEPAFTSLENVDSEPSSDLHDSQTTSQTSDSAEETTTNSSENFSSSSDLHEDTAPEKISVHNSHEKYFEEEEFLEELEFSDLDHSFDYSSDSD